MKTEKENLFLFIRTVLSVECFVWLEQQQKLFALRRRVKIFHSHCMKSAIFEICKILRVLFLKTTYLRDCGMEMKMVQ